MEKTVIGTGIFNLDIIVKRDYPEWPQLRPFTDNVVLEEVGGNLRECNVYVIQYGLGCTAPRMPGRFSRGAEDH